MTDNEETKKRPLAELFEELQNLTDELEDDTLPLEEAFAKYQKGMELLKGCKEAVDLVENALTILEEE